jgi:hypothetical protein
MITMGSLTPEYAGNNADNPSTYTITGTPKLFGGRPPPSQQLSGIPGPDPSGATAPPGSPRATPTPAQSRANALTGTRPNLDPGPPGRTSDQGEAEWADHTDLPRDQVTTGSVSRVAGSDPPVEGCAEKVEYDQSIFPPAHPPHLERPIQSQTHIIADSAPRFGPGAEYAFSSGMPPARPTQAFAQSATCGLGVDPWSAFSSKVRPCRD